MRSTGIGKMVRKKKTADIPTGDQSIVQPSKGISGNAGESRSDQVQGNTSGTLSSNTKTKTKANTRKY